MVVVVVVVAVAVVVVVVVVVLVVVGGEYPIIEPRIRVASVAMMNTNTFMIKPMGCITSITRNLSFPFVQIL